MRGHKDFNVAAFRAGAERLRNNGFEVFSPAENDIAKYGDDCLKSETGDNAEAEAKGFNLRQAMLDDLAYICLEADAIALLPGSPGSKGARAELALALALDLPVISLTS